MHALLPSLLLGLLVAASSCYQSPKIPRDQPLSCSSNAPVECPIGFRCVDDRFCAPEECLVEEDCPLGLLCGRNGCVLPGALDGGGADGGATFPDAPADAGMTPDVGGGS